MLIKEVVTSLNIEFLIFQDKIMTEIFGDTSHRKQQNAKNMNIQLDNLIDECEVKPGGKAAELRTLMQVYRLHKFLSARICEYIFILRKSYSIVSAMIGKFAQ